MGFSLRLQYTWYDAFPDPDDLDQVQAAVSEHLPSDIRLDWDQILTSSVDELTSFSFPYDHAAYFTSALEQLCDSAAPLTDRLDFLPAPLAVAHLDLSTPERRWRLYSTKRMLTQWERMGSIEQAKVQQLAAAYRGGQTTDLEPKLQWAPVVAAYCITSLVRIAELATEYGVPAGVFW